MPSLYPFKLYVKQPVTAICLLLAFAINLSSWGWIGLQVSPKAETFFLHYTVLFGVDTIGSWEKLFIVPGMGLAFLILNGALGWFLFSRDKYLAHVLNVGSLIVQLFVFATAFLLVTLNA